MLARVPPFAKPFSKVALLAAACANAPFGTPGAIGMSAPVAAMFHIAVLGGLLSKFVESCAGYKSLKIPAPPRTTMLLRNPGDQAKPARGSQTILSRLEKSPDCPTRTD